MLNHSRISQLSSSLTDQDNFGDDGTSTAVSGLFHGFLTIGTLGSEPVTPTFTTPLENIAEEETEVTENHLKLINDELEKFLEAEEHGSNESPGRNSPVNSITLGGKPIREVNAQGNGKTIMCPLQGYLFGSSIELAETKIAEEIPMGKCGKLEMKNKHNKKPVKHLINKILKKIHPSSPKETNSATTKKKLQKVIKMFHRKVHPESESSVADRESKNL
ncbi:protein LAZY 1-like [Hibiscus syriacus]|uniref:protein LAZY 1-like n=1 Tax=Hibiscus syriacus TaxID=106335 RepID=UPI00192190A9|nr:protein LAZY 1-like [Hibiscus syriacus]